MPVDRSAVIFDLHVPIRRTDAGIANEQTMHAAASEIGAGARSTARSGWWDIDSANLAAVPQGARFLQATASHKAAAETSSLAKE